MGEIINLRAARKRRERAAKEAEAAANRRRFGRTKPDKVRECLEAERTRRALDGKRLEPDDDKHGA